MNQQYPEGITSYEFARWAALLEAVDLIAEKCDELHIDFNGDEGLNYIKPLQILKYLDERTDQIENKIRRARQIESQYLTPREYVKV